MTSSSRLSWRDIRDEIRRSILEREYAPGDRLPRDADIAQQFNCARATVQRAMQDLSDNGIVERRRKGGTRVRPDPVTRATFEIPVTKNEIESKGSRYDYQLLSREIVTPHRHVKAMFGLMSEDEMLRVQALHFADNRPYILEDRWICTNTSPEILEVDLSETSANEWLVHNKPYSRVDLRFFAEAATEQVAELLNCDPGAALFVMERTTWVDDKPITSVKATGAPGYQLLTSS